MYLKRLELAGFKSFADRTTLEFEPGITAIVGPNGCGKSNISDAIRWVLGEQSAKALRGAGMTDFIFAGTEARKPMGMAEVSLTLCGCEPVLGTEYHEVTITRRVYRSGEGEYLLNRTPCRLKDIQRLFMDTGIGTNSYSLMEQGRIDLILSSRPEDRREVFEEASGISRFKADRRDALRKLEQTEMNLQRLGDILREVRSRIISLQRQAGKARRYQALRQELRAWDLFLARRRLETLERDLRDAETRRAALLERQGAIAAALADAERRLEEGRARLEETDRAIDAARELAAQARAERHRTADALAHHEQRCDEYRRLMDTHQRELDEARARAVELANARAEAAASHAELERRRDAAERDLAERTARLREAEAQLEASSQQLHALRAELLDLDHRLAQASNQLADLDAREKGIALRRERLRVEHAQLRQALTAAERLRADWTARADAQRAEVRAAEARFAQLAERRRELEDRATALHRETDAARLRAAELAARLDVLRRQQAHRETFAEGARAILDGQIPVAAGELIGPLAQMFDAAPEDRLALEAALRAWADAVIVRSPAAARELLRGLEQRSAASARLVALFSDEVPVALPTPSGGVPLAARVRCAEEARALAERLLRGVYLVDEFPEAAEPPPGVMWVTRGGRIAAGLGRYEWIGEGAPSNPIALRRRIEEIERDHAAAEAAARGLAAEIESVQGALRALEVETAEARRQLDVARVALAMTEGEGAILARQEQESRRRADTVAMELEAASGEDGVAAAERERLLRTLEELRERQTEVRRRVAELGEDLRSMEQRRAELSRAETDARIAAADRRRECEAAAQRREAIELRASEIGALIRQRTEDLHLYRQRLEESVRAAAAARDALNPLEAEEAVHLARASELRAERDREAAALQTLEQELRLRRDDLDAVRRECSTAEVQIAELRLRRQAVLERATADHHATPEEVAAASAPAPADGAPSPDDLDAIEAHVAELRARLDSMGPVNLVAIEECEELERRYQFQSAQQEDLVRSRQQLMDLIRRINQTSTEMFRETFARVNEKFDEMFARLFGGGTAKLVLVDETDVLESGIEIIARPPGKKHQSVSLLSGGERALTAVALLFALYAIKPSPFCVLDELDAPLDESNIGRFLAIVREFTPQSQFIVITHNRQTIAAADVLYGITMQERGVSKVVSVKFRDGDRPLTDADSVTRPAATPA
ncbi:MAG: chromosome segregation protein SMC [Kiritimatiellae bacterium]|nr:chromosome segregation protein SMC [Kiritimatiellia bacterium]